jgi:hypothetical protein
LSALIVRGKKTCLNWKNTFERGEDAPLFVLEMFPGGRQGFHEQTLRFSQAAGPMHPPEMGINLLVILVQAIQFALFLKGVVQRRIGQIRLRVGMPAQHPLDHRGQGFHLLRSDELRENVLDLIKYSTEKTVLSNQRFSDRSHTDN